MPASAKSMAPIQPPVEPDAGSATPAESGELAMHGGPTATKWYLCLSFITLGCLAFAIDLPLSRFMVAEQWPQPWQGLRRTIHDFLGAIEPFGQPPAVIAVSWAVLLCVGRRRGVAFRILAGALSAGLLADLLKLLLARLRPHAFHFEGSVLDTFHGILPGVTGTSHTQSWPSAHTATAVGFCLALSSVFPRGRLLFVSLAIGVALQRIETAAHFLSDTLFGAAVGCAVWILVFGRGHVGRWFDRLEAKWADQ
jgi:membrane-associated phospholipid phosphatase